MSNKVDKVIINSTLQPGSTIADGRFYLQRKIGAGSHGDVFLSKDTTTDEVGFMLCSQPVEICIDKHIIIASYTFPSYFRHPTALLFQTLFSRNTFYYTCHFCPTPAVSVYPFDTMAAAAPLKAQHRKIPAFFLRKTYFTNTWRNEISSFLIYFPFT